MSRQAVDNDELANQYANAFPASLRPQLMPILQALPPSEFQLTSTIGVVVDGETVEIPYRIYNPPPSERQLSSLTPVHRTMINCLYSRHNDGYVRQRSANELLGRSELWVAPFVVELLGEYVIEIVKDIARELDLEPGSDGEQVFGRYAVENPERLAQVHQRAVSYWNCYHRFTYPLLNPTRGRFSEYPAFALLNRMKRAVEI